MKNIVQIVFACGVMVFSFLMLPIVIVLYLMPDCRMAFDAVLESDAARG